MQTHNNVTLSVQTCIPNIHKRTNCYVSLQQWLCKRTTMLLYHKNLYPKNTQENALLRLLATMVMQTHNSVTLSIQTCISKNTQENALLRLLATMVMQTHKNVSLSIKTCIPKKHKRTHCYVSLQQWLCKRTTMLLYPYEGVLISP